MKNNSIFIIDNLKKDQQFEVGDSETKTFVIFLIDGKEQNGEVRIIIKGQKTKVQILGLVVGSGKQKINLYTLQDHLKGESISDLLIKSVLFDESKFNYRGLIKIEKNAQKSDAYQKNQNLLLSDNASVDSKPYLEILANNVRCTHGVTIGNLDKDQLYYLSSRGITKESATQLLINGFCQGVLKRIEDDKIRGEISGILKNKIRLILQGNALQS